MFNSFSSALSALRAHSVAVDTVGNNLANVNTTGFKASDVAFKDIVAESMGGTRSESGMGVSRPTAIRVFSQGAVQSTAGSLDAAIQGSGFFVIKDANNSELLTRDGSFTLDKQGYVVTLTGERVQQYVNGNLADIQIPTGPSGASATTTLGITANLNATSPDGTTFSTPVEVIDSLGVTHVLTFQFTKAANGQWNYDVMIPGADIGDPAPMVSIFSSPPTETLEFDESGRLTAPTADPGTLDIDVTGLVSGAADLAVKWNLYGPTGPTITQFAQASAVAPGTRDGYASAEIVSVGMGDGGKIIARYGNGQQREVAVLALAMIANPSSLAGAGNNNFRVSFDNAPPTYGIAETGGRGKIKASSLEASTVDIAREFTNLIIYQRGYQANSRVITTADEMSQETLNLKR